MGQVPRRVCVTWLVALFVSLVGPGWEMHTQQGKGKRDWRQVF